MNRFVILICVNVFSINILTQSIIYNSTINLKGLSYKNEKGNIDTITGTSFIYGFFPEVIDSVSKLMTAHPFLVTNKHVIQNMDICTLIFTQAKYKNGKKIPDYGSSWETQVTDFGSHWIPHPNPNVDLAIIPIGGILSKANFEGVNIFYQPITELQLFDESVISNYNQIENIYMSGYPNGMMDSYNNIPIVRMGSLATPVNLDYNGKKEILIDVPVFPGSSGSPVFLKDPILETTNDAIISGHEYRFIGIAYASYTLKSKGIIKIANIATDPSLDFEYNLPLNIALCIKASEMKEFNPIVEKMLNKK